jgi:superfamily II DNA/RNA helicase
MVRKDLPPEKVSAARRPHGRTEEGVEGNTPEAEGRDMTTAVTKKKAFEMLSKEQLDLLSKSSEFGREGSMGKLLSPQICEALVTPKACGGMGLTRPTPVQALSLPRLVTLANARLERRSTNAEYLRDVVVQSETGSGKTLTFVIPIVHWLLQKSSGGGGGGEQQGISRSDGTLVLTLAPTRELCLQVQRMREEGVEIRRHLSCG